MVVWSAETGGRSTPIVLNGRVFVDCRTTDDFNDAEEKIDSREQVVCWDAETGEELWRDKFNVFQTDIPSPRVGWAAMCGDEETGYVYAHSVSGLLKCYTPDGEIVWEKSLAEDFGKISGYGGRTQTPIIDEDRLIVSFLATNWGDMKGPAPKHYYYAFDKKTGELNWISAPGGAPQDTNYSVPVVAVIEGQTDADRWQRRWRRVRDERSHWKTDLGISDVASWFECFASNCWKSCLHFAWRRQYR